MTKTRNKVWLFILAFLLILTIPYILGVILAGRDFVFGGFLLNPIDGNSYLAKMYEGWSGAWTFTLPYTLDKGQGVFLFLFYLFLGHLSRWLNLPLVITFHLARGFGIFLLLWILLRFCKKMLPGEGQAWKGFLLASIGSGLGWLFFFSGTLTSDYWVAEAYPFLSSYANPHFPIGLALLMYCFLQVFEEPTLLQLFKLAGAAVLLAIIMPFGVVIGAAVLVFWFFWVWVEEKKVYWRQVAVFILFGCPLVLYQYWITINDPLLMVWNAQNLTPAPPVWDLLVSLSPAIFFFIPGIWSLRRKPRMEEKLIILWSLVGILLTYFPFSLQRRFLFGIYVPVAILAVVGWTQIMKWKPSRKPERLWRLLLYLSIPTNFLILVSGIFGILAHSPAIYLTHGEAQAMDWIRTQTTADAPILASPELSLWIPAYSGRRVLYGHPFETVQADRQKTAVLQFFRSTQSLENQTAYLESNHIAYILVITREGVENIPPKIDRYPVSFRADDVTIYRTGILP